MNDFVIISVDGDDATLVDAARELFTEYHAWLGSVVCSRTLGAETAALPGVYAPPRGRLLLAVTLEGEALGVVGVRPFAEVPAGGEAGEAEIKRLYVRPSARGTGVGRALAEAALSTAAELGYREVLITTLPGSMEAALAMYERMGFIESTPFYDHSHVADGTPMVFLRRTI